MRCLRRSGIHNPGFFKRISLGIVLSLLLLLRSSWPEMFCKKGVLRNFTKFTGKHLCQSSFLNKVADLKVAGTLAQVFSCEFCEISKTPFFTEQLWWLLLTSYLLLASCCFLFFQIFMSVVALVKCEKCERLLKV